MSWDIGSGPCRGGDARFPFLLLGPGRGRDPQARVAEEWTPPRQGPSGRSFGEVLGQVFYEPGEPPRVSPGPAASVPERTPVEQSTHPPSPRVPGGRGLSGPGAVEEVDVGRPGGRRAEEALGAAERRKEESPAEVGAEPPPEGLLSPLVVRSVRDCGDVAGDRGPTWRRGRPRGWGRSGWRRGVWGRPWRAVASRAVDAADEEVFKEVAEVRGGAGRGSPAAPWVHRVRARPPRRFCATSLDLLVSSPGTVRGLTPGLPGSERPVSGHRSSAPSTVSFPHERESLGGTADVGRAPGFSPVRRPGHAGRDATPPSPSPASRSDSPAPPPPPPPTRGPALLPLPPSWLWRGGGGQGRVRGGDGKEPSGGAACSELERATPTGAPFVIP